MKRLKVLSVVMLLLSCSITGCVSPLCSSDPQTRKEAIQKITDDKELFFIAMNIRVGIKGRWPDFYERTHLRVGEYPEDVRVMAVKQIKDVAYLICCATWNDGDFYNDEGMKNGQFVYKGITHQVDDYYRKLYEKVSPGDAVRKAAKERLCSSNMLRAVIKCINTDLRKRLLPSAKEFKGDFYASQEGTAFVDVYGRIKPDNPINTLFSDIMERETSLTNIVTFVYSMSQMGPVVVPAAYNTAINKLNGISSKVAVGLFRRIFLGRAYDDKGGKAQSARMLSGGASQWVWKIYQYIDDPSQDIVLVAINCCSPDDKEKILGKVSKENARVLAKNFVESQSLDGWNEKKLSGFRNAISLAKIIDDAEISESTAVSIINKIVQFKNECKKSWFMRWDGEDDKMADEIIGATVSLINDGVMEALVVNDCEKWQMLVGHFKDKLRVSKLATKFIGEKMATKNEAEVKKGWEAFGAFIIEDEVLMEIALKEKILREQSLARISSTEIKEKALKAIKDEEERLAAIRRDKIRRLIPLAERDANDLMILFSKDGMKTAYVDKFIELYKGRLLLFRNVSVLNKDISSSRSDVQRVYMQASYPSEKFLSYTSFIGEFCGKYKRDVKTISSDKKFDVVGIVNEEKSFCFFLNAATVSGNEDNFFYEDFINSYNMSDIAIDAMLNENDRLIFKLATALGLEFDEKSVKEVKAASLGDVIRSIGELNKQMQEIDEAKKEVRGAWGDVKKEIRKGIDESLTEKDRENIKKSLDVLKQLSK